MRLAPVSLLSLLALSLVLACSDGTSPSDAVRPAFKVGGRSGFGFNGSVKGFPTARSGLRAAGRSSRRPPRTSCRPIQRRRIRRRLRLHLTGSPGPAHRLFKGPGRAVGHGSASCVHLLQMHSERHTEAGHHGCPHGRAARRLLPSGGWERGVVHCADDRRGQGLGRQHPRRPESLGPGCGVRHRHCQLQLASRARLHAHGFLRGGSRLSPTFNAR